MSGKEDYILNDPLTQPTEELINQILGEKYDWLQQIIGHVRQKNHQAEGQWKYYNDVKQWLFRMMKKKDTIFWMALLPGTARITFYFPGSAEHLIIESNLPDKIKKMYLDTLDKKFHPISLTLDQIDNVSIICGLADLKIK